MDLATFISLLIVGCFVIFIGLIINGYIVVMNIIWWLRAQSVQTIDIIITSLGIVRFILLIIAFCATMAMYMTINIVSKYFVSLYAFALLCSLWWGTVLCVFYCVKITNYNNRLFMRLKMNISRMVPWMLMVTMVVSFSINLPFLLDMDIAQYIHTNSTNDIIIYNTHHKDTIIIIFFIESSIAFFIFCVAIGLLIVSLLTHTRNMRKDSGFSNIQHKAHISAVCNMTSFLLFYAISFLASNFVSLIWGNSLYVLICTICSSVHPSLHSILLVSSNGKLKKSILATLQSAGAKT